MAFQKSFTQDEDDAAGNSSLKIELAGLRVLVRQALPQLPFLPFILFIDNSQCTEKELLAVASNRSTARTVVAQSNGGLARVVALGLLCGGYLRFTDTG